MSVLISARRIWTEVSLRPGISFSRSMTPRKGSSAASIRPSKAVIVSCELLPGPRQITQLLDWLGWHETRPDQTMRKQIGNPGRIVRVALAARHRLDVGRIRQDLLEPMPFQDVPDRLPVYTRRLYRHMGAPGYPPCSRTRASHQG